MSGIVRILGIPGSLRQASFNRAALHAAKEHLPLEADLEIFDLKGIPPFSEDDERNLPARVVELKGKIREADAILIAGPRDHTATTHAMASQSRSWERQLARPGQRERSITYARCSCFLTCTP
jgi:hypothetical protein